MEDSSIADSVPLEMDDAQELQHFGAAKIQSVIRRFLCRVQAYKEVINRYEKIFDPKREAVLYYDKKKDKSQWRKPALLLHHDAPIAATYTDDEAATLIQTRIRMTLSLFRVRLMYQSSIVQQYDEESGYEYYFNPFSNATMWELPRFMGGCVDYTKKSPRPTPELKRRDTATGLISADSKSHAGKITMEVIAMIMIAVWVTMMMLCLMKAGCRMTRPLSERKRGLHGATLGKRRVSQQLR